MSHLIYSTTVPNGLKVAKAVSALIQASNDLARELAVMNAIAAGGATPANLETGNADGLANFAVGVGQGSAFYTAVQALANGLNTPSTGFMAVNAGSIASLDLGA